MSEMLVQKIDRFYIRIKGKKCLKDCCYFGEDKQLATISPFIYRCSKFCCGIETNMNRCQACLYATNKADRLKPQPHMTSEDERVFKGTAKEYVEMRAKKHRDQYCDQKSANRLFKLADSINEQQALEQENDELAEIVVAVAESNTFPKSESDIQGKLIDIAIRQALAKRKERKG